MIATLSSRSNTEFSLQNLNVRVSSAPTIAKRDCKTVEAEADTWDSYLSSLREAEDEAIAKISIAKLDWENINAEADAWERRLQIALQHNCEDSVRKALLHKNACKDRARQLKAIIDQHSSQISIIQSQLGFWANQVS